MPRGVIPFPFGNCKICQDKATGVHYGVATCEGCKGFFKRSFIRDEKYKCFFGGNCQVTPQNRNRCKACRYERCLSSGMSIDGAKMGRIPKVDKERALQEQRLKDEETIAAGFQHQLHPGLAHEGHGEGHIAAPPEYVNWLKPPPPPPPVPHYYNQASYPSDVSPFSMASSPPALPSASSSNPTQPPPLVNSDTIKDLIYEIMSKGHTDKLVNTLQQLLQQIRPDDVTIGTKHKLTMPDGAPPPKRHSVISHVDGSKLEDIHKFIQDTLNNLHSYPRENDNCDLAELDKYLKPYMKPVKTEAEAAPPREAEDHKSSSDYESMSRPSPEQRPPLKSRAERQPVPDEATLFENTLQSLLETDLRNNGPLREMVDKMEDEIAGRLEIHPMNKVTKATKSSIQFIWNEFMGYVGRQNDSIFGLCRDIPGFSTVDPKDQAILMEEGYFALWLVDDMFRCTEELNSCSLTPTEITVLCAIQLTNPERRGLTNKPQVKVLNSHYLDVLAYEVQRNHRESHGRILIDIFRILPMLDPINAEQAQVIGNFRIDQPPEGCLKFCEDEVPNIAHSASVDPPKQQLRRSTDDILRDLKHEANAIYQSLSMDNSQHLAAGNTETDSNNC